MTKRFSFLIVVVALLFFSCQKKKELKIPGSYHALEMFSMSRAYPKLDIAPSGYGRAQDQHINKFKNSSDTKNFEDAWESMGPLNTAGRCLALAVNPQSDSTIYLGSASGGLWRSRKLGLGESWEYVPTGHPVLGVSSIAFASTDSMIMYIGTGEVYNIAETGNDGANRATRGSYGIGILKTTDGGLTWKKSLDWSYQNQRGVQSIQIDSKNPDRVFAATTDGVYRSIDSGTSWKKVLDVPMATDVEINKLIILAACGNFGSEGKGIYRSTDDGENWNKINDIDLPTDFQGKIELAAAPSNPNILYASIGNGFGSSDGATWLCRSRDAGQNWKLMNEVDYSKWQGWFAHDVAVHPIHPDTIMAIGIDIYKSKIGGGLLTQKSFGGVTLGTPGVGVPDGGPNYSHSDHHVALYHPNLEDVILFGNDGGLFLSFDGGETFESANGGLQTTQFYNGFSVSHQNPDFAMGGLQDNSTSIYRGSGAWQRAVGGDGSWTGINFLDDQKVFASAQWLTMVGSTNGGLSFFGIYPVSLDDQPLFIAPFVIAESHPNIMYAAGKYVYISKDEGMTWTVGNENAMLNGDPVYALAVSPTNPNVVYAATAAFSFPPALFVSVDAGTSFEEIVHSKLPDRFINDISVDPLDEATIYLAFSGFGSEHLLVSKDYGVLFEDLTNGLPDAPANAIAVDPSNTDHIYFGNDLGVYFSDDAGRSWQAFDTGLFEAVIAMDLKISPVDQKIWLATHGNGAFRRDLVGVSTSTEVTEFSEDFLINSLFPNPSDGHSLYIDINSSNSQDLEIIIYDIVGNVLHHRSVSRSSNLEIKFLNKLDQGIYLIKARTKNGKQMTKQFIVMK